MRTIEPLREAFAHKYPKYTRIIDLFGEANNCEPTWENITRITLNNFVEHLRDDISTSSVKTYCAMFKSVLNLYRDEVDIPKDFAKILSTKNDISQNTWLTESEITALANVECLTTTERLVRDQFIVGCLTGARHSDYCHFTVSNIDGDNLVYVSKKTHIKSIVPLAPIVKEIILQERISGEVCDNTFNGVIRKLCQRAGIAQVIRLYKGGSDVEGEKWQFISSHTARRSFATNVYIETKDIFLTSRLLGHTSVDMTAKYICTTEIPEELRLYFSQFS